MPFVASAVVVLAYLADRLVGEPPDVVHPVAWFGHLVAPIDHQWGRPHVVGAVVAVVLPAGAAVAAWMTVTVGWALHPGLGVAVAAAVLFVATSHRRLVEEVRGAIDASEVDVAGARRRIPALVGRDPSDLSPAELRSAAVESAAENLADGLVAPMLAFVALAPVSLPAAVAAATWVKGVNTLDSMLGYPSTPHGTASARLDDAVMWLPSRLTAALLAIVGRRPRVIGRVRVDATGVSSPNAGWPMGTLARIIDVELVKPGAYVLNADAALPAGDDARRGADLVDRTGHVVYGLAAGSLLLWSVVTA